MSNYTDPKASQNQEVDRYRERITNFSKEFELGLFLSIARKNIWWIVLIITVCSAGSYLYLRYTQPIFQSTVVLQIGDDESEKKILGVEFIPDEANIDSKIELIRSPFIFKQAIASLPLEVSYYHEGNILTEEKYNYSSFYLEDFFILDSSICGIRINMEFNRNGFSGSYAVDGKLYGFNGKHNEKFQSQHFKGKMNIKDLQNLLSAQKENKIYIIIASDEQLLNKYYSNMQIKVINANAKTIEISFRYPNPYISHDVVSAIAKTYNRFDSIKKSESSINILNYLNTQIKFVSDSLRESEKRLSEFHDLYNIQDFEGLSENLLERITKQEENITQEFSITIL
jgi:hypothetical protein